MREVLEFGGCLNDKRSPQEEKLLLSQLRSRLHVEHTRESMIRIGYRDNDPNRVFLITNKRFMAPQRRRARAPSAERR